MNLEDENHHLRYALINPRSLGNRVPYVIELIIGNDLDLLVITETWLFNNENAKVSLITPNGYTIISR